MAGARMGGALGRIHRLFAEGTVAGFADGQFLERFLDGGDEAAFAALVERHGPMVLAVCRSVLGHAEDAEDAYQATFLILVGKGRTIRGERTLAGWLRQVAHRVAVRAGVEAARRKACERHAAARGEACLDDPPPDDWRLALHEEVARLSDRHRLPLLLCDLEGKTHAQAAAELGCGPATVQRRLSRARELLRSRLTRRGIALTAGTLATAFGRPAVAAVPPDWIEAAVAGARSWASPAARLALGQVAATAAEVLARSSLRRTGLGRLMAIAALSVALVALGGIAWGLGAAAPAPAAMPPQPRMSAKSAPPAAGRGEAPETATFRGRVVDPSGRPFAGASLYLAGEGLGPSAGRKVRATSGPDGRFRFEVPGAEFIASPRRRFWHEVNLVARAPGYAPGLADDGDASHESTLTLARDDAPIAGRVVDLEGRPVVGASVKVLEVRLPVAGLDPDELLVRAFRMLNAVRPAPRPYGRSIQTVVAEQVNEQLKDLEDQKEWYSLDSPVMPNRVASDSSPLFLPDATTGPDGRFQIVGIGRGRIARLQLDGPTIETATFDVRTWPGAPIHVRQNQNPYFYGPWTVYGATFEHVAGPTRAIEGVVRDRQTGRPLADILVYRPSPGTLQDSAVRRITDAQGRYRLVGLPLGREGKLEAIPVPTDSASLRLFRQIIAQPTSSRTDSASLRL